MILYYREVRHQLRKPRIQYGTALIEKGLVDQGPLNATVKQIEPQQKAQTKPIAGRLD